MGVMAAGAWVTVSREVGKVYMAAAGAGDEVIYILHIMIRMAIECVEDIVRAYKAYCPAKGIAVTVIINGLILQRTGP